MSLFHSLVYKDLLFTTYRYPFPVIWFLMEGIEANMMVLNSSVNFIIYFATGKHFRDEFIRMFTCSKVCKK